MPVKKLKRKSRSEKSRSARSRKKPVGSELNLELPDSPSKPSDNLHKSVILLYGQKKIGKTSLASQFSKKMLHVMLEEQARELEILQVNCPDYEHLVGWVDKILKAGKKYNMISIDTLPLAYKMAMSWTGKVKGFEHPTDANDFGKSWGFVYDNFERPIKKLLNEKDRFGVMFHAHESTQEIETRDGTKVSRIVPEGSKQVWEFINAHIHNIWYFHSRGSKRFLQLRSDEFAFACTAFKKRFLTPDGEMIQAVPMGNSEEEGYENLMLAFNNEQEETYSYEESSKEKPKKKLSRRKKRARRK